MLTLHWNKIGHQDPLSSSHNSPTKSEGAGVYHCIFLMTARALSTEYLPEGPARANDRQEWCTSCVNLEGHRPYLRLLLEELWCASREFQW